MLPSDRRRVFGPWVWACAFLYFLLRFYNILYMLDEPENSALIVFQFSGTLGLGAQILPLLCALPAAGAFAREYTCGFSSPAVLRAGKSRYLRSKVLGAALSGGLVPAVGDIAFFALLHVLYRYDPAGAEALYGSEGMIAVAFAGIWGYLSFFLGIVLIHFFAGMFWALSGLVVSAWFPNLLWAVCTPLILYQVSIELYYWTEIPLFCNLALLQEAQVDLSFGGTLLAGIGLFGLLSALAAGVFARRAKRRLSYA